MSDVRHVVFDLGRVLFRWEPEIPYRRLIPDEARRKRFLEEICTGIWLLETDRGMTWKESEDALVAQHPHEEAMIRAFRPHWEEMLPGQIDESVAIAHRLIDSGIDVTALTNWAGDTFPIAEARFPVLARMRGITVSARVGLVKPDLAIYRHHAETFGLEPARTLFFDDNPKNIEAARAAGWKAELFTDAGKLDADLAKHGLRTG